MWGFLIVLAPAIVHAGTITIDYSGTIRNAITVGGSSIPVGSSFSGQLSYDSPQTGTVTSFQQGTQSVFTFNSLTLTIGGQTVTEDAGQLGLYNDVNPPNGVPVGDSFYTFVPGIPNNAPNPSTGTIDGVTPNYIYLGFVDPTGNAFSGPGLPQSLTLSQFKAAFIGINYGPLGAGNKTTINAITSLGVTSSVPEPSSLSLLALGLLGASAVGLRRAARRSL